MYGVTMPAPGVSKLVSVKLKDAAASGSDQRVGCREIIDKIDFGNREFAVEGRTRRPGLAEIARVRGNEDAAMREAGGP